MLPVFRHDDKANFLIIHIALYLWIKNPLSVPPLTGLITFNLVLEQITHSHPLH